MFCTMIRFMISNALDSDRDNPGFVRRHIVACPGCRRFHDLSHALTHRLVNDAPDAGCMADLTLVPRSAPIMRNALVFVPAMLCLIVAGFFLLDDRPEPVRPADGEWLIAEVDQIAETTASLLPDNPLAREIMLVAEDTKGAVDALLNCTGLDTDTILIALND